jgi:hypothetical protein
MHACHEAAHFFTGLLAGALLTWGMSKVRRS